MLLTKQILENHGACGECMYWYISNGEPTSVEETIEKLLLSDEREKFGWSNWLLSCVLPLDDKIRYAIFAAELVIDIFEKRFPEDKRPRNAIEAARKYLSHKDAAAADAAYAAARAAADAVDYAARAARTAAYAARAAAREAYVANAVRAAAYADYAADYAARAADAAYVDRAEAYVETYTKIINYGLSLLKSK
ncbi:MAG: putative immunity protein [Phycisphaerae bacterium]